MSYPHRQICMYIRYRCTVILLMEEILHELIGSLSHYLHGFTHPRWCWISSINSRLANISIIFILIEATIFLCLKLSLKSARNPRTHKLERNLNRTYIIYQPWEPTTLIFRVYNLPIFLGIKTFIFHHFSWFCGPRELYIILYITNINRTHCKLFATYFTLI